MPELPEVEIVRRGLVESAVGQHFETVELKAPRLRTPLTSQLRRNLPGQSVLAVERRAKFLLFETEDFYIVNHLGMTGSWRLSEDEKKHDHVVFRFRSGRQLVFNDPRRFGLLELVTKDKLNQHSWIKSLGPEPFMPEFNGDYLFRVTRGLKSPIKNVIMDQKRVVGVGNIYASEALFGCRVRPLRPAARLRRDEAKHLVNAIQQVLGEAIAAGGSTIRDYKNTNGQSGRFQNRFKVYGRADEPCTVCRHPVKSKMVAGRNTYWCSKCQR